MREILVAVVTCHVLIFTTQDWPKPRICTLDPALLNRAFLEAVKGATLWPLLF
jgi:hypothetical protein